MERLSKFYDMKKDPEAKKTYYEPRRYLVANVGKFDLPTSSGTVWFMSGVDYFKKELNSVLEILSQEERKLDGKTDSVIRTGYHPKLDASPVLNDYWAKYYQNLIGVLKLAVDVAHINIHVEFALIYFYFYRS